MANKPCTRCGAEIIWPDDWKVRLGGPANPDGSAHKITCQGAQQFRSNPQAQATTSTATQQPQIVAPNTNEDIIEFAQAALRGLFLVCKEHEIEPEAVREQVGAVFNTAMISASKR